VFVCWVELFFHREAVLWSLKDYDWRSMSYLHCWLEPDKSGANPRIADGAEFVRKFCCISQRTWNAELRIKHY